MKYQIYLILFLFIMLAGCDSRSNRLKEEKTKTQNNISQAKKSIQKISLSNKKIGKAIFYLENSGSMFGYVNGYTEYVDVISELAEKPKFVQENTERAFYFINGGQHIQVTTIGMNPNRLIDKLNVQGFNCGDVSKSNLNTMFQIALSKAKADTISILFSDAIYDIGKPDAPMNALSTEGRETRARFIERLNKGDLETILIKLESQFNGKYFPTKGGSVKINQKRPYYIWIFGNEELLNNYFPENYIKSLKGFVDVARFLKLSDLSIPYQVTAYDKRGSFQIDHKNKNKLLNAKLWHKEFQFSIAVDFSKLPFSDSYLESTANYSCNSPNYVIKKITKVNNIKLYGLDFKATHLITVNTSRNPLGKIEISLLNTIPNWILETNINSETGISGDTTHTFGFKFLTDAISQAYQYENQRKDIVKFKINIASIAGNSLKIFMIILSVIAVAIIGLVLYTKK